MLGLEKVDGDRADRTEGSEGEGPDWPAWLDWSRVQRHGDSVIGLGGRLKIQRVLQAGRCVTSGYPKWVKVEVEYQSAAQAPNSGRSVASVCLPCPIKSIICLRPGPAGQSTRGIDEGSQRTTNRRPPSRVLALRPSYYYTLSMSSPSALPQPSPGAWHLAPRTTRTTRRSTRHTGSGSLACMLTAGWLLGPSPRTT